MAMLKDRGGVTDLDATFERYRITRAILSREAETARANPLGDRVTLIGVVQPGLKPDDARRQIGTFFEASVDALDQQAVLSLCAAFERVFQQRLANVIGAARIVLKTGMELPFPPGADRLIRDSGSFRSLDAIFALFGEPDTPRGKKLASLRKLRNDIAHGTIQSLPSTITVESIQALLQELLSEAFPR